MARDYALDCLRVAITHRLLVWLFCRTCGNVKLRHPARLMRKAARDPRYTADVRFVELERHMKCRKCGGRECLVIPHGKPLSYQRWVRMETAAWRGQDAWWRERGR